MSGLAGMPAAARWVEFQACGLDEGSITPEGYAFAEAPNLGRIFLWATSGIVVTEIRVRAGAKACTGLAVGAYRYIVIGSYGEVICKLDPTRPYCKEPR